MFNFFDEIKNKIGNVDENLINDYNIVNISGKILYVEGHMGITILAENMIAFKIKKGRIVVEGEKLFLKEITSNTLIIEGKISKVETF